MIKNILSAENLFTIGRRNKTNFKCSRCILILMCNQDICAQQHYAIPPISFLFSFGSTTQTGSYVKRKPDLMIISTNDKLT